MHGRNKEEEWTRIYKNRIFSYAHATTAAAFISLIHIIWNDSKFQQWFQEVIPTWLIKVFSPVQNNVRRLISN